MKRQCDRAPRSRTAAARSCGQWPSSRARSTPARAHPGRLSALSVSRSKSVLYGAFVWAPKALNRRKRRFPAPPGSQARGHAAVQLPGAPHPLPPVRASRGDAGRVGRRPAGAGGAGGARARSHCRSAQPFIHFTPDLRTCSVPLFLKWQCGRTLGGARAGGQLAEEK
jgi:hypothetical protein